MNNRPPTDGGFTMKKVLSRGDELYGRDVFHVLMEYEIARSRRYPSPISLVHMNILPNATDEAALQVAPSIFGAALNSHIRSIDIPSGLRNECLILLPTTDENGGRSVCERLLSVFKNKFETPGGMSVTFSLHIGLASHSGGQSLWQETLLEQAETALKQSKFKGPNTYIVFSDL